LFVLSTYDVRFIEFDVQCFRMLEKHWQGSRTKEATNKGGVAKQESWCTLLSGVFLGFVSRNLNQTSIKF
jgi:hypothetical protein